MHPDPLTVPRQILVQELVDDYVYRHHSSSTYTEQPRLVHHRLLVVDGDRLLGSSPSRTS